jgi:hypothetical protein
VLKLNFVVRGPTRLAGQLVNSLDNNVSRVARISLLVDIYLRKLKSFRSEYSYYICWPCAQEPVL